MDRTNTGRIKILMTHFVQLDCSSSSEDDFSFLLQEYGLGFDL